MTAIGTNLDMDAGIVKRLTTDAALMAMCPGGVHWDLAPQAASDGFVLLSHHAYTVEPMQGGCGIAWETFTYVVEAVMSGTRLAPAKDAAARIRELLAPPGVIAPVFTVDHYGVMKV